MATTVISTEKTVTRPAKGSAKGGRRGHGGGNGGRGTGGRGPGGSGGGDSARPLPDHRYRIGMWVALASIMMLFTALSSAYIVRSRLSTAGDWQPIAVPHMLWLSTALILLSSVAFEASRRSLRGGAVQAYRRWLAGTALLGLGFLLTQLLAWRELVSQGIYLATNPHSAFFYLLTAVHGLHLLGGIVMLALLLARAWARRSEAAAAQEESAGEADKAGAVAVYWHFMDGLWIYLFLLLFVWR
jgi:cytochrome c oxidase subunit III